MQTTLCKGASEGATMETSSCVYKSYIPPDCIFFCMCARILSLSLPLPSFIDFQRRLGVLQEENKNPTLFIGIYACNVMWYMVRICNNHRMPWCTILLHLHSNDWGILYNALQESWIATCAFLIQLQTIKASLLVLWHFVWAKRHRVLM